MSDTRSILRILEAVRRRVRGNRMVQAGVDALTALLGAWLALALWNALMPVSLTVGWPVWAAVSVAVLGIAIVRIGTAEPLWRSASRTDRLAELHDELTSAYWFSRQDGGDEWVDLHLDRASDTARGLSADRLIPLERPRRLVAPAGLALALIAVLSLPVPRVFDDLARRIAELDLVGSEEDLSDEPLAALEELGDTPEPESLQPEDEDEMLVPMSEEAQQEGQEALESGEEEGEPGEQEGEPTEGEEPGDQAQPGEQTEGEPTEAENPEDTGTEAEGEPSQDPAASQDEGEGDSTEQTGPMLPGGDEVFLQEGGEDIDPSQLSEEEMGHATREGGGEEMLEAGEVTSLEVQLEQEMLAVPEDVAEPEDEEKEELVTRAESSYLEFERVEAGDYAVQELLQAETIPWRYRQLVLQYFRQLRERDNQQPQQDSR